MNRSFRVIVKKYRLAIICEWCRITNYKFIFKPLISFKLFAIPTLNAAVNHFKDIMNCIHPIPLDIHLIPAECIGYPKGFDSKFKVHFRIQLYRLSVVSAHYDTIDPFIPWEVHVYLWHSKDRVSSI